MSRKPPLPLDQDLPSHPWKPPSLLRIYGALAVFFLVLGVWLAVDLQQGYQKILSDTSYRAMQRSQIISQSIRTQILATDYVLRDVLGRIEESDIVYPDRVPEHAQRMTRLLKEKADTVPDFFSMVIFDRDCVFTATHTGENTGVRSKAELCEARRRHSGSGPLASYVSGAQSASGQSVLVLSRHLSAPGGLMLGGVLGVIQLDRAQNLFYSLNPDPGDSVALLDESRVLLARLPALAHALEKRATELEIPSDAPAAQPQARVPLQRDVDGRERLFGFSRLEGFPFVVAYGIDKDLVLKDWRWRAGEFVVGYLALLLLALAAARSHWTTLRQREDLRAGEEHFRMLAENMADIVWRADAQMRFSYINSADQALRGYARDEVIGTAIKDHLTAPGQAILAQMQAQRQRVESVGPKGTALNLDVPMRRKDGGEIWIEASSVPIYGNDGSVIGFQGIGRDISERRRFQAELLQSQQQLENQLQEVVEEKSALQELATRDALTGLYNRRFLDAALLREFARSQRDGKPLTLIMLDLDHFKKVNDQYGHAAGDEVLKVLAEILKKGARESDLICRYGGEEFVAVMPHMTAGQALERVESWRRQLQETTITHADARIGITLSAGIAVFPAHGHSPAQLLTRADEMLYKSKQEGRNRITVCALP